MRLKGKDKERIPTQIEYEMKWVNRSVADVCEIVSGSTPSRKNEEYWSGSDVPWFTVKDVRQQGHEIHWTKESVSKNALETSSINMVPRGTVLVCCTASIGEYALAQIPLTFNQQFNGLVPNGEVDSKYLMHWASTIQGKLLEMSGKATVDFVSQSKLKSLSIPLPPLEEQKRIAGILDEADRVRKKTQALIDKYDELAQSLFLDMFGDPVTNPKGWEVKPLGELFQISTGKTPSTKDSENFNGNIPFVTPPDFNSDDETDRFLSEKGAAQSRIVPKGSLLVTCIGSIGKTKIVDLPSCFNQQINAIEIGSGWHPEVLEFAVQGMRSVLEAAASATTVPILNKGNFQKIKVFVPPAELQESFTSRYRQIQRSVGELKSGKEQGQALFNSLLQKAFKGELT